LIRPSVSILPRPHLAAPQEAPMLDLTYLALLAALFLLSVWMIRAFDRL
jgi:hypothetical protein